MPRLINGPNENQIHFVFEGLFDDPAKSAEIANSVGDNEEVYFVPAFSGLGVS